MKTEDDEVSRASDGSVFCDQTKPKPVPDEFLEWRAFNQLLTDCDGICQVFAKFDPDAEGEKWQVKVERAVSYDDEFFEKLEECRLKSNAEWASRGIPQMVIDAPVPRECRYAFDV